MNPRPSLAHLVAATQLAVQIATAQGPIRDIRAVGPLQIRTHVLHGGVAPADDDAVTRGRSTVADVPGPSATLPASTGLTINAIFDVTITSDPNAAAIESTINAAIANIQSKFSDPIIVTIDFKSMATGLGESSTYFATVPYSTFLAALKADATTRWLNSTTTLTEPTSATGKTASCRKYRMRSRLLAPIRR
jgi:hypothetical protein